MNFATNTFARSSGHANMSRVALGLFTAVLLVAPYPSGGAMHVRHASRSALASPPAFVGFAPGTDRLTVKVVDDLGSQRVGAILKHRVSKPGDDVLLVRRSALTAPMLQAVLHHLARLQRQRGLPVERDETIVFPGTLRGEPLSGRRSRWTGAVLSALRTRNGPVMVDVPPALLDFEG